MEAELQKIVDAGAALTPKGVLESARKKSSPLHKYFEWEDSKAAEKYRLEQAYRLISMTKFLVVLEGAKGKKPTFSPVRKYGQARLGNHGRQVVASRGEARHVWARPGMAISAGWASSGMAWLCWVWRGERGRLGFRGTPRQRGAIKAGADNERGTNAAR